MSETGTALGATSRSVAESWAWMRGSVSLSGEGGSLLCSPIGTLGR